MTVCGSLFRYCGQLAKCSLDFMKSVYTGRSAEICGICFSDDMYINGGFAHHPGSLLSHQTYHNDCLARWFHAHLSAVSNPLQEPTCPSRCSSRTFLEEDLIPDATNLPGLIKRIQSFFDDIALTLYDPRGR
jgi:hypothetical protein